MFEMGRVLSGAAIWKERKPRGAKNSWDTVMFVLIHKESKQTKSASTATKN